MNQESIGNLFEEMKMENNIQDIKNWIIKVTPHFDKRLVKELLEDLEKAIRSDPR